MDLSVEFQLRRAGVTPTTVLPKLPSVPVRYTSTAVYGATTATLVVDTIDKLN